MGTPDTRVGTSYSFTGLGGWIDGPKKLLIRVERLDEVLTLRVDVIWELADRGSLGFPR
jgi:hypothetical protein